MHKHPYGSKFEQHTRIIWAIAAKDLTDAIQNKVIWQAILSVGLVMALYKLLPIVTNISALTHVTVYDAGESILAIYLENDTTLETRNVSSLQELTFFVAMAGTPELGLAIPAGFDRALQSSEPLQLDGYVQHWVSADKAHELEQQIEREIADQIARPVDIDLDGHRVYPRLDGFGPHTWAALNVVMVLAIVGLSLTPQLMIEEKQTHTFDALLTSPASSGHIVAGKALTAALYCLTGITVVLAFNARLVTRWDLVILAVLSGILLVVALGLLLGTLIDTKQSLKLWELGLTLGLVVPVVLTGMAVDLPAATNDIVRWLPPTALGRLFLLSMSDRAPLAELAVDLLLTLIPSAIILIALAWRLDRSDR